MEYEKMNIKINMTTVEYMNKIRTLMDKLEVSILKEYFDQQYTISGELEKVSKEFREYQVKINDSK